MKWNGNRNSRAKREKFRIDLNSSNVFQEKLYILYVYNMQVEIDSIYFIVGLFV